MRFCFVEGMSSSCLQTVLGILGMFNIQACLSEKDVYTSFTPSRLEMDAVNGSSVPSVQQAIPETPRL